MVLVAAMCAAFISQLVKGVSGFGSALVFIPLATLLYGPREAIFLSAMADLLIGAMLVVPVRNLVSLGLVMAILLPMFAGQWIGTALLVTLPVAGIKIAMSIATAALALSIFRRPVATTGGDLESLPDGRTDILALGSAAGLAGGVAGGMLGASGPPLVWFMRTFFRPEFFRAQLLAVFFPAAITLTALLVYRGVGTVELLPRFAALVPFLAMGGMVGRRLAGRFTAAQFGRFVATVLLLAAAALLWGSR